MVGFGLILMLGGVGMFGGGVGMIVNAASAHLLSIALAMVLGVGGTILFGSGAVVLAIAGRASAPVVKRVAERTDDDSPTGPIRVSYVVPEDLR